MGEKPVNLHTPLHNPFCHKFFIFWPDEIFELKYTGFSEKNYIMKKEKNGQDFEN